MTVTGKWTCHVIEREVTVLSTKGGEEEKERVPRRRASHRSTRWANFAENPFGSFRNLLIDMVFIHSTLELK